MRRALLGLLLCGLIAGCDAGVPDAAPEAAALGSEVSTPRVVKAPPIAMPTRLSHVDREDLLETIAGAALFAKVLRTKEATGRVVEPGREKSLAQAELDLERLKANLAVLSKDGPPTYLLIHSIVDKTVLTSWLIGPDGGVVRGRFEESFSSLGGLAADLGVTRLSESRGPRPKKAPPVSEDVERAAAAADKSPAAVAKRGEALAWAALALAPGAVGEALGTRSGRLLVVAARDTGTAPFAALPLKNGVAARNWSFVILPELGSITGAEPGFDFGRLNLDQAVVVGDPDLSADKQLVWPALPGARAEATEVARRLADPETVLMVGPEATRANLVRAINERPDAGIIYLATHAIADPKNPLTRGYVAMSGGHYYAGHIRQERFKGWREHHPLVVISACQTALGRVLDGGGFGVARTWHAVGAGQVVASLWNVSDRATFVLMTNFVARMKAGSTPETAMREAQLITMNHRDKQGRQPYLNDPKMWASFAIYGKPTLGPKRAS